MRCDGQFIEDLFGQFVDVVLIFRPIDSVPDSLAESVDMTLDSALVDAIAQKLTGVTLSVRRLNQCAIHLFALSPLYTQQMRCVVRAHGDEDVLCKPRPVILDLSYASVPAVRGNPTQASAYVLGIIVSFASSPYPCADLFKYTAGRIAQPPVAPALPGTTHPSGKSEDSVVNERPSICSKFGNKIRRYDD